MATFAEMIPYLLKGKKIKNSRCKDGAYYYLNVCNVFTYYSSTCDTVKTACIYRQTFEDTSWEVIKEPLVIEAGKTYKTNEGFLIKILETNRPGDYEERVIGITTQTGNIYTMTSEGLSRTFHLTEEA